MSEANELVGDSSPAADSETIRLLLEEPSAEDLFDGKAHLNTAKVIANLIEDDSIGVGRVIGLEGSWGSGKSTIVGLVLKQLDRTKTATVTFDSWAHQDDPLRRSFLQQFINTMEELEFLDANSVREFRKKLSGKESNSKAVSSAILSLEGRMLSLASLLVPLGGFLSTKKFLTFQGFYRVFGVTLLIMPIIVIFGFMLTKSLGRHLNKFHQSRFATSMSNIDPFSFFAKTQNVKISSFGYEQGEPTSVEFEELFKDIVRRSSLDSRQVLVVLDNLDRVEASSAKQLLATMQTFINISRSDFNSSGRKIWLLIPYDPSGLDQLWGFEVNSAGEINSDPSYLPLTSPSSVAFVEKIFDIRLEAPPLALTDWHTYLRRLLVEAFPGQDPGDLEKVVKLRIIYPQVFTDGVVSKEAPTPRQLKNFVNQLGVLRRQTALVHLIQLGFYALLRQDRLNVAELIRKSELRLGRFGQIFGLNVEGNLAGLHFGTDPDSARQLLIGPALERAFDSNSVQDVSLLKVIHGFAEVVRGLEIGYMLFTGGSNLTKKLGLFQAAKVFEVSGLDAWLRNEVCPEARNMESWSLSGYDSGVGLAVLFREMSHDTQDLSVLLQKISQPINLSVEEEREFLSGIAGLIDTLIEDGIHGDEVRVPVRLEPGRIVASLSFLLGKIASQDGSKAFQLLNPGVEMSTGLVLAANDGFVREVNESLVFLVQNSVALENLVILSTMHDSLDLKAITSVDQVEAYLNIAESLGKVLPSEDLLVPLAQSGVLLHLFSFSIGNEQLGLGARAALMHLGSFPSLPEPTKCGDSVNGRQMLTQLLLYPTNHPTQLSAQHDWLRDHFDEAFDRIMKIKEFFPLWTAAQIGLLSASNSLVLTAGQFLPNLTYLLSQLGETSFSELFRKLILNPVDRDKIISESKDPELVLRALLLTQDDSEESIDIRTWASAVIMGNSQEQWTAAVLNSKGEPLIKLGVQIVDHLIAPLNPPGLAAAIHDHFKVLADGQAVWVSTSEEFEKLSKLLDPSARDAIASELCSKLEAMDGEIHPQVLGMYRDFLAHERSFRSHPKLPNFVERAVTKEEWNAVRWIVDIGAEYPDLVEDQGRKESVRHLRNIVVEKLDYFKSRAEYAPRELTELAKLFGV